jgi:glycosyltransferase involved in cell wall biosynthesis
MRVAVYGEFGYRTEGDVLSSDESFALFAAGLADHCERVLLVGRHDPAPGHGHHKLRGDVDFVPLPHYPSLARGFAVAAVTLRSVPRLWRTLGQVDAVWVLGPTPIGVVFAQLARMRRRGLVLGVRQDLLAYARSRHPGRRGKYLAARLLEWSWMRLARRHVVTPVGAELSKRYAGARRVVPVLISLIAEKDVVSPIDGDGGPLDGEAQVLSVGRLEPQKNPLILVEIAAELAGGPGNWRLVICGSGSMEDEVRSAVAGRGVGERVSMPGYVAVGDGLEKLYRESDLFLHTSWTEGFPQVLLEAFAAGLPVVATSVGGIDELPDDSAVFVPPGDPGAAVVALRRLAADGELRARIAEGGRRFVLEHTMRAECRRVAEALEEDAK